MANNRISPLVILPPVIFLALAAMFVFGLNRENPDALPSAIIGKPAPTILGSQLGDLPMVDVTQFASGDIKLVNFWGSNCPPCWAEHPNLLALADQGIEIIGLNYNDSPKDALKFLQNKGNPFRSVLVIENRTAIEWGVAARPETFLIDKNGIVALKITGPLIDRTLEKLMPAIEAAR